MKHKQTLSSAVACVVLSLLLLTVLYFSSGIHREAAQPFTRTFRSIVELRKVYDIKYNSYYIAGVTQDSIYLGNLTAPLHAIGMDNESLDTQHIEIKVKNLPKLSLRSTRLSVRDRHFFISDGSNRTIITGHTGTWKMLNTYIVDEYFNDFEPIDSSFFAVRAYGTNRENILGTISARKDNIVQFSDHLLEKQIDGIFCTDGMLHYVPYFDNLVYVYYYRNEYIVFGKALNLVARSNTLDTISFAQIESHKLVSSNTYTMTRPPVLVNRNTCVWDRSLLINSPSLSKNENREAFRTSSVIDVYDLQTRTYSFSFRIADYNGQKLKSFTVSGNTLIALFDHYFIAYTITM